jgi:hypothetical protein
MTSEKAQVLWFDRSKFKDGSPASYCFWKLSLLEMIRQAICCFFKRSLSYTFELKVLSCLTPYALDSSKAVQY